MAQEKATATIEEPVSKTMVDEAITSIEKLYETLTGGPPAPGDTGTPIPVERDPGEFVGERLERLVDALGQPFTAGPFWAPAMVVWESAQDTVICLDLPGVKRAEIEVLEDGGLLIVAGRRTGFGQQHRLQLAERPLGPFRRQIVLPRWARSAEVTARLDDGVLEIRLAKGGGEPEARRKIEIR